MKRDMIEPADAHPADAFVRFGRRGLWLALIVLAVLGVYAVLTNALPDSHPAHYAGKWMMLLPITIVFAIAWLRSSLHGKNAHAANEPMRAVLQDELRQTSMQKAFRAAFWAMLLCQPLLGFVFVWMPLAAAPQIMASVTVVLGTCVFLGAVLLHDR